MKKKTKTWLLIASSLLLVGCALFVCVMSILKWDFTKLSTAKYETNTYEVGEEFDAISIDTDTADIVFALSDDGKCRVECYEDEKTKHSVAVENHTLVVGTNPKAWYDYIGLGFRSPKITVYLPGTEYTSLLMDESTGDIEIPKEFHFNNVDISSSTGHVHFYASASGTVKVKTSTGHIRLGRFARNINRPGKGRKESYECHISHQFERRRRQDHDRHQYGGHPGAGS